LTIYLLSSAGSHWASSKTTRPQGIFFNH